MTLAVYTEVTMKFLLLLLTLLPGITFAYTAKEAIPMDQFAILELGDPANEDWYVGKLRDFPHTFEFTVSEPQTLRVQAMVFPDVPENERVSLILVREVERGVEEVMRRTGKNGTWVPYEAVGAKLSFLEQEAYIGELTPGVYRLEVSNPANEGQYVLKVGFPDDSMGYWQKLANASELRSLTGRSQFGLIKSSLVFMPLFIVGSLLGFAYIIRRRQRAN